MKRRKRGKVYIVGAGPGDPLLLTEKGRILLSSADTVLYDHLANPAFLLHAKEGAKLTYVGKEAGRKGVSQNRINRTLLAEAMAGKTVVRLKGGDPVIFGRGAEEAMFLLEKGVHCEIIPGVSSALAAPTAAGIPLTLRGRKSSVTIITGQEARDKKAGGVDWENLLKADSTFVILMGVKNIEAIVEKFVRAGKSPSLPAAIIQNGTMPSQRTVTAPLSKIAQAAGEAGIRAPAVLVVGETVKLRMGMSRRRRLPLKGLKVLIARPRSQVDNLARLLEGSGATPILCPLIEIKPPRSFSSVDRAAGSLENFDWIVFTSVNAVRFFMGRLAAIGKDSRHLRDIKICAIGPATAAELSNFGLRADRVPHEYSSRGILREMSRNGGIPGRGFLLLRSNLATEILPSGLMALGGRVTTVTAYRTVKKSASDARAKRIVCGGDYDIALLTSASVADAYGRITGCRSRSRGKRPICACLGPETARAARLLGLSVDIVAKEHTDEGIVSAIIRWWKGRARQ